MASTSDLNQSVVPHLLCDYCRKTCDSSIILEVYLGWGNYEGNADLRKRCRATKEEEQFAHCSIVEFQASYEKGCHLCTLFWQRSIGLENIESKVQERKDYEEQNGRSQSVVVIHHNTTWSGVEVTLCTRTKDGSLSGKGFGLQGYVIRELQDPLTAPHLPIQTSRHPTPKLTAVLIKSWIERCNSTHDHCRTHSNSATTSDSRPTRLIDVSNINHIWLRTRDSRVSRPLDYCTLSHCWPRDGQIHKLTDDNLESFKKQIPLEQLSQTFKDAIAITNAMGVRYLWVDSLCIIQDSPEDWAIEADRMADVYGNATVNLVACGPSGDALLQPRNPLLYHPCKIASSRWDDDECDFYVQHGSRAVEDIPAFKRGWIVQERLLSRRNIYFGMKSQLEEITWECFEGNATETNPVVNTVENIDDRLENHFIRDIEHKLFFRELLNISANLQSEIEEVKAEAIITFLEMWAKIVTIYSETDLTRLNDKLIAIAGMARMICLKASLNTSSYIAGMWTVTLPVGLLWHISDGFGLPNPLPERPVWRGAPSWSWASSDYDVHTTSALLLEPTTSNGLQRFYALIAGYEMQFVTGRPAAFGEFAQAKMRMVSILRPIKKVDPASYRDDSDGSKEFGSDLVRSVLFMPDVKVPDDEPLFFLTIFRGWAPSSMRRFTYYKEEGLVIKPHLDGYIRMGYMRVLFKKEENEDIFIDMDWGGGTPASIVLY